MINMISENKAGQTFKKVLWLAAAIFLVKLALLPFAQNTDADAVSRVLFSMEWKAHPVWIKQSIWGPFHFYLNGFFLMIVNDPVYVPAFVNALFSCLSLFPFYFFARREFNERGAFIATIFFSICPILFRNSFLALAETPYLFFIVAAMNLVSKGIRENKIYNFLFAGLCMSAASGLRYEAWFLFILFGIVIVLCGKWKEAFLFAVISGLFPAVWIFQSYISTGQYMNSFNWMFDAVNDNKPSGFESYLRRIWFFPFSWMIALGPPCALITITQITRYYKKKNFDLKKSAWTIPFWIVFILFIFAALKGSLLLQHRFTGTLVVLSLPFFASYFETNTSSRIRNAWVFGILTVGLSFAWNTYGVKPIPRLKDQSAHNIAVMIQQEVNSNSGVIVDFWTWENTYYIAFLSKLPLNHIVILSGSKNSGIQEESISNVVREYPTGIILLKKGSELYQKSELEKGSLRFIWMNVVFSTSELLHNDDIIILRYSVLNTEDKQRV